MRRYDAVEEASTRSTIGGIAASRGRHRALVVVLHKLAIAIWHVLTDKVAHRHLSADYYARRNPECTMHHIAKQANGGDYALNRALHDCPHPLAVLPTNPRLHRETAKHWQEHTRSAPASLGKYRVL